MFDFLRESLLCSSDDSPKRDMSSNPRRRPGEIISSQGAPVHPPLVESPAVQTMHWDYQWPKSRSSCSRQRRTPSPLRSTGISSRSPAPSFRAARSFREALGGSLAFSGAAAAQQEESLPGRGLYVPMQRGLGPRGTSRPLAQGPPMAAASYEASPEDALDQLLEAHARLLPGNVARVLLLRKLALGEYEVDNCRVSITMQGTEAVVVHMQGVAGEDDSCAEPLMSFLYRAADAAFTRSVLCGNGAGGSFEGREAMRIAGTPSPMQGKPLPSVQAPKPLLMGAPPRNGMSTPTMPAARISPPPGVLPRQAKGSPTLVCGPAFITVNG
mmetsp:Transcript_113813/g.353594  ORF Transcript_113813/g.353594 Transcript_113813/m.353594 type:complete len:327 (+) Transcript_113813:98-1078(+)